MPVWLRIVAIGIALFVFFGSSMPVLAQDSNPATENATGESTSRQREMSDSQEKTVAPPPTADARHHSQLLGDFLQDQKELWTSPSRLRFSDTTWLVPVAGITTGLFMTDAEFSRHLSRNPKTLQHYSTLSNAGIAGLAGGAGAMWLLSYHTHNEHWRETGFLAAEAAMHSLVMTESMKYSLRRDRPFQGDGSGAFFQGGTSFPSEHAAAAWSIASVIAHEYPGPLTKILAYGAATMVSFSRVRARDHFPSDVVVGALIGELTAHQVFSRHHDPELGGGEWRSLSSWVRDFESAGPQNLGSPYVPLDSWIYPALARLAALGLVDSGFSGMRPWTRRECMRQTHEAEENLGNIGTNNSEALGLVEALEREFHTESETTGNGNDGTTFRLESVYSRTQYISGTPLTDGYHFGQTLINDFGRPYGQGWNTVNGFSAYATWGPWVAYVRGEAQTAPSIPALSLTAREAIQAEDLTPPEPLQPGTPQPSVQQFTLLDAYVGLMLSNWQVTFGKQSLWWGPGDGGPLDFSNNSQPINMFRINRTTPVKLPSILGFLGPMRTEFFLGQLAGQQFIMTPSGFVGQWGQSLSPQPFIHGQRISFKPTRNFEFGFFRTTIYGGPGYPLTLHNLARSLFSTKNENAGGPTKPGNRTSAMDFSYRLPHLRDWVTFYGEAYTDDQFSPIAYMDRSAWQAGLYFSHIPRVPKLDLRIEGVYTDVPGGRGPIGPGSFYSNGTWRSGYTNDGNLIGSWVGRGGQGAQAWTNYWFTPRTRLQFNFRHQKVSQQFVPGGGTLTDFGVRGDFSLRPSISVTVSVQGERWLFPVIQPGPSRNVATSIGIVFEPQKILRTHRPADSAADGGQP